MRSIIHYTGNLYEVSDERFMDDDDFVEMFFKVLGDMNQDVNS